MSSMSDNIPNPAPHEDALAQARAAVIQVLTSTAEQRDQILQEATTEREGVLSGARSAATSILDQARGSATQLREEAEAEAAAIREQADADAEQTRVNARREAETIVNEARGAAERVRGDAAADAHRTRTQADSDAQATAAGAQDIAAQVSEALAELRDLESRFAELAVTTPVLTDTSTDEPRSQADDVEPDPPETVESDSHSPESDLPPEQFDDFMRQLAKHLDTLDRARSTGDRDEVGRVLHDLGDLADRSHADELAVLARHLGPDARPEELDELITQCYQVRQDQPTTSS